MGFSCIIIAQDFMFIIHTFRSFVIISLSQKNVSDSVLDRNFDIILYPIIHLYTMNIALKENYHHLTTNFYN